MTDRIFFLATGLPIAIVLLVSAMLLSDALFLALIIAWPAALVPLLALFHFFIRFEVRR